MKNLPFATLKMRRVLVAVLLAPLAVGAQTSKSSGAGAVAAKRAAVTKAFQAGDYPGASQLGDAYLRAQPHDNEVRLMVANSYAWTGRYEQAIHHYSQLADTDQAAKAKLGMANVYRWNGLAGAAEPLYRQVLTAEPGNKDAAEGLTYAQRETRPMTSAGVFLGKDNLDTERRGIALSHRRTDASRRHRLEIEVNALQDKRRALKVNQRDVTLRYAGIADPLKPKLEISAQQSPDNALFAAGEIRIPNTPVTVGAGRVNWGKMAFDPNALAANLTANQLRLQASMPTPAGAVYGSYSGYRVSDRNRIQDVLLKLTPAWQPLKVQEIKFFVGYEARTARFNSPAYWSPADGNHLVTVGVGGDWVKLRSERSFSLQYGYPVGGEAVNSYSASAGLRYWLSDRVALHTSLAHQRSARVGAYRATTGMVTIQGAW